MVMPKILHGAGADSAGPDLHHLRGANRHLVTVSFDPFNSADPSVAVTLPLFVVIIAVGRSRVWWRGHGDLVPQRHWRRGAAPSTRPMRARRGRNWRICAPMPRLRGMIRGGFRPGAGRPIRVRRARQAGRDVVEPAPSAAYIRPVVAARTRALKAMSLCQNLRLVTRETLGRRAAGRRRTWWDFVFFRHRPGISASRTRATR